MRRAALLALALVASACADGSGGADPTPTPTATPTEAPTPTPTPTATSDDLEDASCDDRQGGDPSNFPDFVEVSIESEGATEKVEFRFEPEGDPGDAPQYFVGFTDQLITDGEGAPVDVEGEAFVSISFMARGVDLSGEEFEPIYTGPTEFTPGLSTVLEVEQTGDFEGLVSWGIGLSSRACFVVEARPDRIILEFPAS